MSVSAGVIIGLVASVFNILSGLSTSRRLFLMTSATATAFAATTLVVNAGGITAPILVGVVALLTSTVRNLYWLASDSFHFGSERTATSVIAVGVLTLMTLATAMTSSTGTSPSALTALTFLGTIPFLVAFYFDDFLVMKTLFAFAAAVWVVFDVVAGSWGTIPGDAFAFCANVVAIAVMVRSRTKSLSTTESQTGEFLLASV